MPGILSTQDLPTPTDEQQAVVRKLISDEIIGSTSGINALEIAIDSGSFIDVNEHGDHEHSSTNG